MKTLGFIFDVLSDLNCRTSLIEACCWDEERADILFERASTGMYEIFKDNSAKSWQELKSRIGILLSDEFNSQEIDVMLEIIESIAQKNILSKDDGYNN